MTELLRKPAKVRHITRKEKGKSFFHIHRRRLYTPWLHHMVTKNSCHCNSIRYFLLHLFLRYVCPALGCGRYELQVDSRSPRSLAAGCWATNPEERENIRRRRRKQQLLSTFMYRWYRPTSHLYMYTHSENTTPVDTRCSPSPAAIMPQQYCL